MGWVWGGAISLSDQWQMCSGTHYFCNSIQLHTKATLHTFEQTCTALKESLIMLKTYWPKDWHNDHPVVNKTEKESLQIACHGWLKVLLQQDCACWQKPKSWWYHQNNDFIIHIFISNKQDKHISSGGFIIMCTHHPSNWLSRLATTFLTRPHTTGLICSESCDTLSHLCFGVRLWHLLNLWVTWSPGTKESPLYTVHAHKKHTCTRETFSPKRQGGSVRNTDEKIMHNKETKQNEYYEILDRIFLNYHCQTVTLANKFSKGNALLLKPTINVRRKWRDIGEKSHDTVNRASVTLGYPVNAIMPTPIIFANSPQTDLNAGGQSQITW